ncbi:hypothetical protein, partial [Rhodococcus zopfii]
ICTNPNHGAGSDPQGNGGAVMQNPQGGTGTVPCEGTICTNPNHGAGSDPQGNGGAVMQNPQGGTGTVPC